MSANSQQPDGRDCVSSALTVAVEGLNLAKEIASITPAKAVFGSVSVLLVMIRDSMANRVDYVELGFACADVCKALDRGMNGRRADQFGRSVFQAIEQLATTVADIEKKIVNIGKRNALSRLFHSKDDREKIAAWRLDLNRILHVFNTELAINANATVCDIRHDVANTQILVSDIHRTVVERQEGNVPTQTSTLGEFPPPPPRACFGREELIKKIVNLAESHTPVALIGAGGIGKTSVSLAILHNDGIKEKFGDNRRFIRCDQFPASCTNFLARLSKVIGAGIDNPVDLIPLRPFLSSKEMLIVLDNAESILDPQGANGQEIYDVVEELSRFPNICLLITSRITIIPSKCETLEIPTLSTGAVHDTFYDIYKYCGPSDSVNDILKQLDFHPLSVTLLATVAHQHRWDNDRLAKEWKQRRTGVLRTEHKTSLATTIELSLASPLFQELGPDARAFLGVIAFYPQGVNEHNLEWLFPTIPNVAQMFDKFCILSLTYRNNGFITMLAPLRDHLRPNDPKLSPLLCMTKDCYFARMSAEIDPNKPGFSDASWILSEDVNLEHLLDIFSSINPDSDDIWDACLNFIRHLQWQKPRPIVLRPKIEALPDNHCFKTECLYEIAVLLGLAGDFTEQRRLLTYVLNLERGRNDCRWVALTLEMLSHASQMLGLYTEGIHQAKEALEVYEQLDHTARRAQCLDQLARLYYESGQLDAAEKAAIQSSELSLGNGDEYRVCQSHRTLGNIYRSKGDREKAIHHYKVALGLASSFNWHFHLFWIHSSLVQLFLPQRKFDDAYAHLEQAKTHARDNPFYLGRVALLQAGIFYGQHRFKAATSEVLRALEIFEKVGSLKEQQTCQASLLDIEQAMNVFSDSDSSVHDA